MFHDLERRAAGLLPSEETERIVELTRGGSAAELGRTLEAYFNLTS